MIRAFAAIALPDVVRVALTAAGHGLPVPRLVPPENLHLTLVFLGELPEPVLSDIDAAFLALRSPAVDVGFGGLDIFGGSKPRLVYAAVAESLPLRHLVAKLEAAARGAGKATPSPRRYTPHVTLARLPERGIDQPRIEREVASRTGPVAPGFHAEDFRLYRSWLGSAGASYEELARYPLG